MHFRGPKIGHILGDTGNKGPKNAVLEGNVSSERRRYTSPLKDYNQEDQTAEVMSRLLIPTAFVT